MKEKQGKSRDIIHAASKAIISSLTSIVWPDIGGIGGAATAMMDLIITSPAAKRRDKWIKSVEERMEKIALLIGYEELNNLVNNEEFQSLYVLATVGAMKTHQQEKIEALLNSMLNLATNDAPYDFKEVILKKIENLTPSHIKILQVLYLNKELIGEIDNYDEQFQFFVKLNPNFEINVRQYISTIISLKEEGLVNIGDIANTHDNYVKKKTVWGGAGYNRDDLPFIAVTDLGIDAMRAVLEHPFKENK